MRVDIRNLQAETIDEDLVAEAAQRALSAGKGQLDAVEIALVDDARIIELNRRFLGRDGPTDVIAFEAEPGPQGRSGEVIVSVQTAQRQSREAGHSLQREVSLLVAHGVLHVLGYRDDDGVSRAAMDRLQQKVLDQLEGWKEEDGGAPQGNAD